MTAVVIERAEQQVAAQALASGAVVAITGAAGVGKSVLVEQLCRSVRGDGGTALRVRGSGPAHRVPLGCLGDLVDASARVAFAAEQSRDRAATALAAAIVDRERPTVIVVDEAHELDDASRAVVRRWIATRPAGLVLAWRSAAMADADLLADLAGAEAVSIHLGGLAEADIGVLVQQVLGGVASRSLVRALCGATGGNPMLALATVEQWREAGVIEHRDAVWQLIGAPRPPGDLVETACERLARLPADERAALLSVVLAEPADLDLVLEVCPEEVLERLEVAGLVALDPAGFSQRVRVAHPTTAEAMLRLASAEEVAAACRALAAAAGDVASVRTLQRATWIMRSTDAAPPSALSAGADAAAGPAPDPAADPAAVEVLVRGAEEARSLYDHTLAVELANAAVVRGAGADAGLVLAEVDIFSGRWAQADDRLARLAVEARTDDEISRVANAHAYVLDQLGNGPRAGQVLAEASARIAEEAARGRLLVRAAIGQVFAGDGATALRTVEPALADADGRVRGQAHYAAALALALVGDPQRAVAEAEAGVAALTGLVPTPEVPRLGAALAGLLTSDRTLAEAQATIYLDSCVRAGDIEGEATGSLLTARADLLAGRVAGALGEFQRSLAASRQLEDTVAIRWALAGMAHSSALLGDLARARALLGELDDLGPAPVRIHEADIVIRARAFVAAAEGECARAVAELLGEVERCWAEGQPAVAGLLAADALLLALDAHDVRREAARRVSRIDWPRDWLAPQVCHAVATLDPVLLEDLHEHLRGRGADLDAAIVARARARVDGGDERATRRWQSRAHLVAGLSPWRSASTEPVPAAIERPRPGLTARQREVASRAARGDSSAAIALELSLSVRTVENHLQAVYRAHGLRGRAGLVEVLGAEG